MNSTARRCRLNDQIQEALASSPYVAQSGLRFETAGSRVTLHGAVRSWFQKQMAQEALRRVDGIEEIENLLQVHHAGTA